MSGFGVWRSRIERGICRHPLWFVVGTVAVLGILALFAPVELSQEALAPSDERARVYFGSMESVGQSFTPLPGLREILLPIGRRDADVSGPLILHVRSDYFGDDIRRSVVFNIPAETENIEFRFRALTGPPAPLLWVLEAPHGPNRAYWVYREQDATAFPEGTAYVTGRKQTGNFAFTQVGTQPYIIFQGARVLSEMLSWEKQSLIVFVVSTALVFPLVSRRRVKAVPVWLPIVGLVLATIALHMWFAQRLPLIIDEGAYLQDATQTSRTFWPLRDFLTKGPVYILVLKAWLAVTANTVEGWRLLSGISWAAVVATSAALARRFGLSVSAQILTATCLALLPGVVSATTPLLLQVVSVLFAVMAMLALSKGVQDHRMLLIAVGALLMTAGYLTRASTIAAGVAGAVLVWLLAERPAASPAERWRALGVYIGTGAVTMLAVGGIAVLTMGYQKAAILLNIEALTIGNLQGAQAGGAEPLIRWAVQMAEILWRGGSWILAGVVALPLLFVRRAGRGRYIVVAGWLAVLAGAAYHLSDMGYLLPGVLLPTRATMLAIVFGVPLALLLRSLLLPEADESVFRWRWIAICGVWLGVLTLIYRGWGQVRQLYIVEFLPPLALLAGAALAQGLRQVVAYPLAKSALIGLFLASWLQGAILLVARPVSGTVEPGAIKAVARIINENVPPGEEIFTAQPIVTVASQRSIVAGYSHPGWILYSRLGSVPDELRKIYFAEPEAITQWLAHDVRFVVTEQRTNEVYFDAYPERRRLLADQFELIGEVPNDIAEEPFRLYRRRP